jgi:mRNA-degrading endonuclease toxin of MazEF toxin-antitoxin module
MLDERSFKRGDLYYVSLDPVVGSEQGGTRPALIIQNNTGNQFSPTLIIAPLTSRISKKSKLPTHYLIPSCCGLKRPSIVLLEQIRTVDKQRVRSYIGTLDSRQMFAVNARILISLGLSNLLVYLNTQQNERWQKLA